MTAKPHTTESLTPAARLTRARVRVAALRMRYESTTGMRNALLVALRDLIPLVPVMGHFGGPGQPEFVEQPAPELVNARAVLARALEQHAAELPSTEDDFRAVITLVDIAETFEDLHEIYLDLTGEDPLKVSAVADYDVLRCELYERIRERARALGLNPVDLGLKDREPAEESCRHQWSGGSHDECYTGPIYCLHCGADGDA